MIHIRALIILICVHHNAQAVILQVAFTSTTTIISTSCLLMHKHNVPLTFPESVLCYTESAQ